MVQKMMTDDPAELEDPLLSWTLVDNINQLSDITTDNGVIFSSAAATSGK